MKRTGRFGIMPLVVMGIAAPVVVGFPVHAATFGTLHNFSGADGSAPYGPLIQGTDGSFYGTTDAGGANGTGTVFQLTLHGVFTVLHSFSTVSGNTNADGANPYGGLAQGADGAFYGTTINGGAHGRGTVFRITSTGTFTTLHSFANNTSDGGSPFSSLILGTDNNLYGTTQFGGANGDGTVFKITPSGTITLLHSFNGSDGAGCVAPLCLANNGAVFYGTTASGGANLKGTVFKITPSGTLTTLYSFGAVSNDGATPYAGVVQGPDGNLYGAARDGGANSSGTVYKLTLDGVETTLHSFSFATEGYSPYGTLVVGKHDTLYGTTYAGASGGGGVVFKITPAGAYTILHTFNGTDGKFLDSGLVRGSDHAFYGVTQNGGSGSDGTIYRITGYTPADFNGDGHTDFLFQNPNTGQMVAWYMNGASAIDGAYVTHAQDPVWRAFGLADVDSDGSPDILFQNRNTGQLAVWLMHGLAPFDGVLISPPPPSSAWQAVADDDRDGDGETVVLFQNVNTGQMSVWYLSGTTVTAGVYVTQVQDPRWRVVGVADFNRDGQPDILFQNVNTGQLAVWYLNAQTPFGGGLITPTPPSGWLALAIEDANGDGWPDIVFQNPATGRLAIWYMNGLQAVDASFITPSQSPNFQLVAPH